MAIIGDVEFNLLSESRTFDSEITQYSVEDGTDITDHVKPNWRTFSIEGIVGDAEDPPLLHSKFVRMQRKRGFVDYSGRAILTNCLISNFQSNVDDKSARGFRFSMTITQVKVSKPSTVALLPIALKVDVEAVKNAGRVQVQ